MKNELSKNFTKTEHGVWVDKAQVKDFGYTDGAWVEKYLTDAFNATDDLSTSSAELETHIIDWNTEYHLTRKRHNLLANLSYDRNHSVLEIGCGCGAISRFLGETFDNVTSVEGSYERARLARMRTRDLESVEVVNSRFQDLGVEHAFDAVFCIGVWEYSPSYVDGPTPFEDGLAAMKRMLKPGGYLVLAIENQFGLKYLANSREDHTGTFFEGPEGYPRTSHRVSTFGRKELEKRLADIGETAEFFYPVPDYKIPDALLSEKAFDTVDCGELLAAFPERDYAGQKPPFFDTRLVWPQLTKNGMAMDMANSFLVVVGGPDKPGMGDDLGFIYNNARARGFETTTILRDTKEGVVADKALQFPDLATEGPVSVKPQSSPWLSGDTVAQAFFLKAHRGKLSLREQLADVKTWYDAICAHAEGDGHGKTVSGEYVDLVWQNAVVAEETCTFFDRELVMKDPIPVRHLLARAAFLWLLRYNKPEFAHTNQMNHEASVRAICEALGERFDASDVEALIQLEATLQSSVGGGDPDTVARKVKGQLKLPKYKRLRETQQSLTTLMRRANNLRRRVFSG